MQKQQERKLDLRDQHANAHHTIIRIGAEVIEFGPCNNEHARWIYDTEFQAHRAFVRHVREAA
jgi:hypothetical protein